MNLFNWKNIFCASPQRATLLSSSGHDSLPRRVSQRHLNSLCSYVFLERPTPASFLSLCNSYFSTQRIYVRSLNTSKKIPTRSRKVFGMDKTRHPGQSVMRNHILDQVYLSGWARIRVSNIVHKPGMGNTYLKPSSRLPDKINWFFYQWSKEKEKPKEDRQKERPALPVPVDASSKELTAVHSAEGVSREEDDSELNTLEKTVEKTNRSIESYYDAQASSKKFLVKHKPSQEAARHIEEEEIVNWNILKRIPSALLGVSSSWKKKPLIRKKAYVSKSTIEAKTREIVSILKETKPSSPEMLSQTTELRQHLRKFRSSWHEATGSGAIPKLLRLSRSSDEEMRGEALEALALLGYTAPIKGRGIRILALDGGGTRGLVSIQCLKMLEKLSQRKIYELFDYVSGVSTGALIASIVCLFRIPLDECEQLYLDFSQKMFSRSRVKGTGGLVWNYSFYDSGQWEHILRTEIGHKAMIEFARDPLVPKVSAVSTLMNTPTVKKFVFRNYNFPPSVYSEYPGSCTNKLWEVIRASSAAPGYYEDFSLGDFVHSDGGLSTNNPTGLAVHESRLLWPHEPIQCVLSLGTGRYEPTLEVTQSSKVSLREKINKVVDSVTDTEAIHIMMTDLMPPATYFRFNPYLSENLQLDEIRPDLLQTMKRDTEMYLRKNELKMRKAVALLKQERQLHQHVMDWFKFKSDSVF